MIEQFAVCSYSSSLVVVLTNTVFNDVESILIAPIKSSQSRDLVKDLQIPCRLDNHDYFVDLLDIATVSKRLLKTREDTELSHLRNSIKAGIDLLIDGFQLTCVSTPMHGQPCRSGFNPDAETEVILFVGLKSGPINLGFAPQKNHIRSLKFAFCNTATQDGIKIKT